MRLLVLIIFLGCGLVRAQDKIFFKNGTSRKGIVVTNAKDYIYFKATDTSETEKISKSKLVLMEDYKGNRYLFAEAPVAKDSIGPRVKTPSQVKQNIISVQPLAALFGRGTFYYERLTKDGKIGFAIPLILTYDPSFGNVFVGLDSTYQRVKGISYITGLDVNFYLGKKENVKVFLGPRIRYGTDIAFLNIEGYSVQTQFGLRVNPSGSRVVQHFSVGFGFVRIVSATATQLADPKQSYPWFSLNYRLGVSW